MKWKDQVRPLLGGISAIISVIFSNPVEVVKTRLQLQEKVYNENASSSLKLNLKYTGLVQGFAKICREEGLSGIQSGLVASMLSQATMNGFRYGAFDPVKCHFIIPSVDWMYACLNLGAAKRDTLVDVLGGFCSGALGGIAGNPFNRLKAQLQSDEGGCCFEKGKRMSTWDGMKAIYKNDGLRGYFKGLAPSTVRNGVAGWYDKMKVKMFFKPL